MLSDSSLLRALRSGLPLRFHYSVELWRDGWLTDELADHAAWSLVLYHEPVSGQYSLTRSWDPDSEGWFNAVEDAAAALGRWYRAPIAPNPSSDRYYYEAELRIEILSPGDLAELEHWLRGEARRDGDVGGVLTRGFRRLLIRLVGLSARTYRARTEPFRPQ